MFGVSPRGALALQRASRALAASIGRAYVVADDVKVLASAVLEHRLLLSSEAMMRGVNPTDVLAVDPRLRARSRDAAPTDLRLMLTRRGWSFVGAAVGLYLGGRLLGLVQLAVLAVATVLLLVGAYVWVRLKTPRLEARRTLKELLQVGVEGRVDLTVTATQRSTDDRRRRRLRPRPAGRALPARAARAG